MSRVGKRPAPLPQGVQASLAGNTLTVKGPRGTLSRELHRDMCITIEGDAIKVQRPSDGKLHRSLHGLTRTLVANMIEGVTKGFQRNLELSGTGYRAAKVGPKLVLTVGLSHQVEIEPPAGIEVECPTATTIVVKGNNKELVGEVAAKIRAVREPSPYGEVKGIRYAGEVIRRKAGKAGK